MAMTEPIKGFKKAFDDAAERGETRCSVCLSTAHSKEYHENAAQSRQGQAGVSAQQLRDVMRAEPAELNYWQDKADRLNALLATAPPEQAAPVSYPRPCGLCPGQIESEADLDWHGIGNCVPICHHCGGSGQEPTRFIIRDEESAELAKLEASGAKWKQSDPPQATNAGALTERITAYLSVGGLFNPEMAEHVHVRDLLIACREALLPLAAHDQKVRAEVIEEAVQAIIDADMIVKADEPRAIEAIRSIAMEKK